MKKPGKKIASPAYRPLFPPTSSLIAREDLVLPAAFNDLSPLARELQPLKYEDRNEVHRFLGAFLDLSRFNAIRKMLWLIAVHGAPRSLYYQRFLGREIVIAEELDLHLIWAKSRIFIKPLPDFLLNYDFWENHISSWTEFARIVLPNLDPKNSNTMDTRFQYGELRLNRLDTICRYSPYKFSVSSILQGFPQALTESYVPYMEQYNNAVSALQQAAYGFALFAIILCAALIGLFVLLPLISSLATVYGSIIKR
ncbi:hypothetical protein EJ08DRAFT_690055 [Tothia fuscella]|uniref:Uncharacterized protein n=1 Tax=Tothia fuscella TaxID=1048955 RepID=A0A9P4TUC0_9PEZI|nr:hypothetical protein EJ08DRAFT_690055 [Tothia fuscella]